MTKEEAKQGVISKERTTLEKYVAAQLFELGDELAGHKEYSFNRGVNVGMTKAYEDILEKLHNQPSLPSNLEEAAEKYAVWKKRTEEMEVSRIPNNAFWMAKESFKAGAEWVASQRIFTT